MSAPVLDVERLRVELAPGVAVVEEVSFTLAPGEVLALVGESGSGKTTTGLALLGFARPGATLADGRVTLAGRDVLASSEREVRALRGRVVSYVPQDPSTSLNPAIRIGDLLAKVFREHNPGKDALPEVESVLARVRLPNDAAFRRRFPHQLSGGQQQRVALALALICSPQVIVMDEPTTGLDVLTQSQILLEVDRLRRELGIAIVYITHNLASVAGLADRVAVMYAGRIVEDGPIGAVLERPRHPYARGLIAAVADHREPRMLRGIPGIPPSVAGRPPGCPFAPRCPQVADVCLTTMPPREQVAEAHVARCFRWRETPPPAAADPVPHREPGAAGALLSVEHLVARYPNSDAAIVDDVSFAIMPGEAVALAGQSGSGKTTLARCVAGLHAPDGGRLLLAGAPLAPTASARSREARRRIQIVFQNPYDSLNPRIRIGEAVAYPARAFRDLDRREAERDAVRLLERVRLPAKIARRFPRELSGGERQRVAIARALAAGPELLICDEITSALDVSVQAAVLELLGELRESLDLSLLFISHDLGVIASLCDRVLVLNDGRVCESGTCRAVLTSPQDDYTRALLEAAPSLHDEPLAEHVR